MLQSKYLKQSVKNEHHKIEVFSKGLGSWH